MRVHGDFAYYGDYGIGNYKRKFDNIWQLIEICLAAFKTPDAGEYIINIFSVME